MADTSGDISPEAQARKRIDDLEAENKRLQGLVANANSALADVKRRDDAAAYFKGQGVANAHELASIAIQYGPVREAETDTFTEALESWHVTQRNLFATGSPSEVTEPVTPPAPPFAQPNPAATGEPVNVGRIVMGDDRWKDMTGAQRLQAMRENRVEVPGDQLSQMGL